MRCILLGPLCALAALTACDSLVHTGRIFGKPIRGGAAKEPSLWESHKPMTSVPDSLVSPQSSPLRKRMEKVCRDAQSSICKSIEELDGEGKFRTDAWTREGGGGGISKVLAGGKVFEKAGVNLSVVYGKMPKEALKAATEGFFKGASEAAASSSTKGTADDGTIPFFAVGISSVMHPRNPHCPTMHFNYRYFETAGGTWWFGGGTDLTPSYLDEEDVKHFHGVYKDICDKYDPAFYDKFKKWADDYFVIAHRGETRGVGGIFYDDLNDRDPEELIDFARDGLAGVIPAYAPIVAKHMDDEFSTREKEWQLIRRGRYTEFNLVYDRGTLFGMKTGGRVESILMSLPETARWEYDHQPEKVYGNDSPEAEIMRVFKNPRKWV